MNDKQEVLGILIMHCRVLARSPDPRRRIAASEVEIELTQSLERAARIGEVVPMAASFSRRDEDPGEAD